jgi:hypothetical protein
MQTYNNYYKKMDWDNFFIGLICIAIVLFSFFYFKKYKDAIIVLGMVYIFGPILGLIQHLIFYNSDDFKNFVDLHRALISGNLKYYDIGSKFLVYSLFLIQIFGIGLVISELV